MKKKFRKKIDLLLIIGTIISFFSPLNFPGFPQDRQSYQNLLSAGPLLLIIIDFKDFFCPFCLEYLSFFCDLIYSKGFENFTVGILTFRNEGGRENVESEAKIMERRLRGFIIGNNIRFPVILDRFHALADWDLGEYKLIYLDLTRNILKKYTFPLTKEQLDEIFFFQKQ
ncbi:MAG: hypothetical protein QHH14_13855 [Clostridiales bacterium]|nr:hypothetical protein [Clostridiales bacterium]